MRASLLVLALLAGCTVKDGRAPGTSIPAGITVPVTIAGRASGALDTAWLDSHAPDFHDGDDRRAWKISSIAGPVTDAPGSVIEVLSDGGTARLTAGPRAIALATLNRNGEVVVALADPADPFPAFHGRGGNRGHSGGDVRVRGATAIHVLPRDVP